MAPKKAKEPCDSQKSNESASKKARISETSQRESEIEIPSIAVAQIPTPVVPQPEGNTHNPLNLNPGTQLDRYSKLCEKEIAATRYLCPDTLRDLGLLDDVLRLFEKANMGRFVELRAPTYRDLTLEFLSTLEVSVTSGAHVTHGQIVFRIGGRTHVLTLTEFSAIFGLPPAMDIIYRNGTCFHHANGWKRLTNRGSYHPRSDKASYIPNPAIRYAQRVLARGLFARDDSIGVVRKDEVFVLSGMLDGTVVDVGALLADHFLKTAMNTTAPKIHIGGLITPIALHFDYDPAAHGQKPIGVPGRLDLETLESMRMIKVPKSGRPRWIYPNKEQEELPSSHTTLLEPENLHYQPEKVDATPSPVPRVDVAYSSMPPPDDSLTLQGVWQVVRQLQAKVAEQEVTIKELEGTLTQKEVTNKELEGTLTDKQIKVGEHEIAMEELEKNRAFEVDVRSPAFIEDKMHSDFEAYENQDDEKVTASSVSLPTKIATLIQSPLKQSALQDKYEIDLSPFTPQNLLTLTGPDLQLDEYSLRIQGYEDDLVCLGSHRDDIVKDLLILQSSHPNYDQSVGVSQKEVVLGAIESKVYSPASVCSLLPKYVSLKEKHSKFTSNMVGVVALLGSAPSHTLSRLFADYLGEDKMLAIVCRSSAALRDEEDERELCLIAVNLRKEIRGRHLLIYLEDISPYDGIIVKKDHQRRLALPNPTLPCGEIAPGFLGYAVNMIHIDCDHLQIKTISGHGIRETLFYLLFGELQVYETKGHIKQAIRCIKGGAISLDGGFVHGNGVISVGSNKVDVHFPVMARENQTSDTTEAIEKRKEELTVARETISHVCKQRSECKKHFEERKAEYRKLVREKEECIKVLLSQQSLNLSSAH